mgnify:CR=1 FL=1
MFLNFIIFLVLFFAIYFSIVYIVVTNELKSKLEPEEYKALKSFSSKCKEYDDRTWNGIFDGSAIAFVLMISAFIYFVLFFVTFEEKQVKLLRRNDISAEFVKTYERFGIERQNKFVENKYTEDAYGEVYYNKDYFKYLYRAGENVSDYVNVSLDGDTIIFKVPQKISDNTNNQNDTDEE